MYSALLLRGIIFHIRSTGLLNASSVHPSNTHALLLFAQLKC